ncbi:hypothetical protein AAC387_Pa03g1248 [Persea americana]
MAQRREEMIVRMRERKGTNCFESGRTELMGSVSFFLLFFFSGAVFLVLGMVGAFGVSMEMKSEKVWRKLEK